MDADKSRFGDYCPGEYLPLLMRNRLFLPGIRGPWW